LIMEQWRKYLAEDMSEATTATIPDVIRGQRFVTNGPATSNKVFPSPVSMQSLFRDEDDDEDVEDDEEAAEEDEDIELEEE